MTNNNDEQIKNKIFQRFKWEGNAKEDRAFANNMLKYIGQEELARQHNDNLKEAISLALSEKNKEILYKINESIKFYQDEEIRQRKLTKGYEGLSSDEKGALEELHKLKKELSK